MDFSIVIPLYNEEHSINELFHNLSSNLYNYHNYEIIFVNDGSIDNSLDELKKIKDSHVKIISLESRKGKSEALFEGFKNASFSKIVTMDSDLQDNPENISIFIEKLNEGYDAVYGVRIQRKDSFWKKMQSLFANWIANHIFKEKFKDRGCAFKAFKKEIIMSLSCFEGIHRFFPTLLKEFKTIEVEISHCHRKYGKTKYPSIKRLFQVMKNTRYVKRIIK